MQPDLERLLRESRRALPDPDAATARRAIAELVARGERAGRRRRLPFVAALVVAGMLVASLVAVAAERVIGDTERSERAAATSRIVDRTFSCSVAPWAGARPIKVSAVSGFRDPDRPAQWKWRPGADLSDRRGFLVSVSAGVPPSTTQGPPLSLAITQGKCSPTTARLALSARGLIGGRASRLPGSDRYECRVGSRVIVRIRSVFRTPTRLSSRHWFGRVVIATPAAAVAREAQLAVRTPAGKRLVYADVLESGRARLFTAPGCSAD